MIIIFMYIKIHRVYLSKYILDVKKQDIVWGNNTWKNKGLLNRPCRDFSQITMHKQKPRLKKRVKNHWKIFHEREKSNGA